MCRTGHSARTLQTRSTWQSLCVWNESIVLVSRDIRHLWTFERCCASLEEWSRCHSSGMTPGLILHVYSLDHVVSFGKWLVLGFTRHAYHLDHSAREQPDKAGVPPWDVWCWYYLVVRARSLFPGTIPLNHNRICACCRSTSQESSSRISVRAHPPTPGMLTVAGGLSQNSKGPATNMMGSTDGIAQSGVMGRCVFLRLRPFFHNSGKSTTEALDDGFKCSTYSGTSIVNKSVASNNKVCG